MNYHLDNHFLNGLAAEVHFKELWDGLSWEKRPDAPRMEFWTNDFMQPYTYGRGAGIRTYISQLPHQSIIDIRRLVEAKLDTVFEGCFCNGYTGERDWLGWHADDDPAIDHRKPIVVVSLGAARQIQVRQVAEDQSWYFNEPVNPKKIETYLLDPGSMFVMPAGSQFTHQHRIPKVGHKVGPRISLTFRGLVR